MDSVFHSLGETVFLALAIGAFIFLLVLLIWRRHSLGGNQLSSLEWLANEPLRLVHAAATRRLFIEAAFGAAVTLLLHCLFQALSRGPASERSDTWRASILGDIMDRPLLSLATVLFTLNQFLFLWLIWTLIVPSFRSRHHWFVSLRALHAPRSRECSYSQLQTYSALAYCTNAEVVANPLVYFSLRPNTLEGLWNELLLLQLNRSWQLLADRKDQNRLQNFASRIEQECAARHMPLLNQSRVREAFGVPASMQLLALVAALLAVGAGLLV